MSRSHRFTLNPQHIPDDLRPVWGDPRSYFKAIRAIYTERMEKESQVTSDQDLNDAARSRKLEAVRRDAANAADREYAKLRMKTIPAIQKLTTDAYQDRRSEKLTTATDRLLDEMNSRLARSEVHSALEVAQAQGDDDAFVGLYHELVAGGDQRSLEIFERLAPERLEKSGAADLANALRAEMQSTRDERLPDDAKLLLDHADQLLAVLELAELSVGELGQPDAAVGAKLPSLLGVEAGFGAAIAGLEE